MTGRYTLHEPICLGRHGNGTLYLLTVFTPDGPGVTRTETGRRRGVGATEVDLSLVSRWKEKWKISPVKSPFVNRKLAGWRLVILTL